MSKRKQSQESTTTYQQVLSSHVPITPVELTCDDLDVIEQARFETTLAEADDFFIDRQYTEATESDQPRAAALAGYLHPREWPPNAGHGLRRTA